jgi:hypothetical protein
MVTSERPSSTLRQALVQQQHARAVGHCQHYQMHYRILRTHRAEQLMGHFKAFPFMTLDITMSNADTRQLLE